MSSLKLPPGNWYHPERSRIPALPKAQQGPLQKLLLAVTRRQAKSADNLNVFMMLARLGAIFPRYLLFLSHILMKGRISRVDKERIILHAAWRLGCVYEWGHHAHMARELGIADEEIQSLASTHSKRWDGRLQALVQGVDELIDNKRLSDATWAALSRFYSPEQMVEFCMMVGHYIMVAVTINSTGVQLEPGYLNDKR